MPRLVTERRHRHRAQLALAHRSGDPGKIQLTLEQLAQRRTVEQRHRHFAAQAQQAVTDKATGLAQHPRPVATVHLMGMKALPDPGQAAHRLAKMQGPARQADRVDGAGRGADDHRKGILRGIRQQIGNRRQHPDLIRRPRAATGKNQSGDRLAGRSVWRHRGSSESLTCSLAGWRVLLQMLAQLARRSLRL
ncbi:hypothetical protein FQZ97_1025520 [compost metagenome]